MRQWRRVVTGSLVTCAVSACSSAHPPGSDHADGDSRQTSKAISALSSAPRIFLNQAYGGGTVLSYLQQRAAAGDPAWLALQQECADDSIKTVDPPNSTRCSGPSDSYIGPCYGGMGYVRPLMTLSLCYQVSGQYAAAADHLLAQMAELPTNAVNDNGCYLDRCWGVKMYGVYISIGLDWLAPALSSSTISAVETALTDPTNGWIETYEAHHPGGDNLDPVSNYHVGYVLGKTLASIALDHVGDTSAAQRYWSDMQNRLWPAFQQAFATRMVGGGWPEGWSNYGPRSVLGTSEMLWAASTGWGVDWASQLPNSGTRVQAQWQQYFVWPSLNHMEELGTVGDPFSPSANVSSELSGILEYTGDSVHAAQARQFTADLAAIQDDREPWQKFLFSDEQLPKSSYSSQPLSYVASGPGQVSMRSSWQNASNTVWANLYGGTYIDSLWQDEQRFEQGGFALVAGDQPIIVNASGWIPELNGDSNYVYDDSWGSARRVLYNTFFTSSARPGQDAVPPDASQTHIERYVDTGTYVRARAANVEQMYTSPGGGAPVTQFMRDLVYVRPSTFVLYDRTTVANAGDDQWLSFHTPTAPQQGTPALATERRNDILVGGSTIGSVCTVLPSNASVNRVTGLDGTSVGRIEVHAPSAGASNDWLHVITQGSGVPSALPVQGGSMMGVLVQTSPRNSVVLFNSDHAGQATTSSVTYTVAQTAAADHVLAGISGSTTGYAVAASAAGGNITVNVTQGGPCALSAAGNLSFSVDTAGNVSNCAGAADGSGNGGGGDGGGGGGGNGCLTASNSNQWLNTAIAPQSGWLTAEWDVTPAAGVDGAVGLSAGAPGAWSDLAVIVRFSADTGHIDARNGATYGADANVPFSAGATYHVRVVANVATHTYSVYATSPTGPEQLVARNYLFRDTQQSVSTLGYRTTTADAGSLTACNFALTAGASCTTASAGDRLNASITPQSGSFTADWDVQASTAPVDAAVALSQSSAAGWSQLAAIVRFNTSGQVDAYNGSSYQAANAIPYTANANYHVRMAVDVGNKTYSTYVTPPGGGEQLVGQGYVFRNAASSLANVAVLSDSESLTYCNFSSH